MAGDSGGAPDAVLPGETGWVVPAGPGAAAEVVERLVSLLEDEELRRRTGEAGREWVRREWSWEQQVERLRGLLG